MIPRWALGYHGECGNTIHETTTSGGNCHIMCMGNKAKGRLIGEVKESSVESGFLWK